MSENWFRHALTHPVADRRPLHRRDVCRRAAFPERSHIGSRVLPSFTNRSIRARYQDVFYGFSLDFIDYRTMVCSAMVYPAQAGDIDLTARQLPVGQPIKK